MSDALPFGRLWYAEPNAVGYAIGYRRLSVAAQTRDTFASSAVVPERFFNFLPNFTRQFPEKYVEEARDPCRIHGIGFDFFDSPMNFPGIPVSARLRKEPDAFLSIRMKSQPHLWNSNRRFKELRNIST